MINLEYMLGCSDQSIILEVNAISAHHSVPITHKTKVRFEMHTVLQKTIQDNSPVKPVETIVKSQRKFDIRMKCCPAKQEDQLSKLKFNTKVQFQDQSY
jgi:hypothetical protein